jgi:hypothetical protein
MNNPYGALEDWNWQVRRTYPAHNLSHCHKSTTDPTLTGLGSTPCQCGEINAQILQHYKLNPLTPNDPYSDRTAPLTSKRCILYIYSTNIGTEYFKHCIYSPFFFKKCSLFHNSNVFGSCIIHILYIYSTNIGAEYFKHGIYSPFFSLQNAVCFIILIIWFLYYSHFIYRMC